MSAWVSPGCAWACWGQGRCAVGWPDGSCGSEPRGTGRPPRVPAHLFLPTVRVFEEGLPGSAGPYHDWCLDNGWPEKAAELRERLKKPVE